MAKLTTEGYFSKQNKIVIAQEKLRRNLLTSGLEEKYLACIQAINLLKKPKIKLFLDGDDVILDSSKAVIDKYNKDYEGHPLHMWATKDQVWDWGYKVPCPLADSKWISEFFLVADNIDNTPPMKMSKPILRSLNRIFDIRVATIGAPENIQHKMKWFDKHFPWLNNFIYVVNKGCKMDKSCINMAGSVFVDDNGDNLASSNADVKITFGAKREYNQYVRLRALDMQELEYMLLDIAWEYYGQKD